MKRGWFVSTSTQLTRVNTKSEALRLGAKVAVGPVVALIHRECECGCGQPAAKSVQKVAAQ